MMVFTMVPMFVALPRCLPGLHRNTAIYVKEEFARFSSRGAAPAVVGVDRDQRWHKIYRHGEVYNGMPFIMALMS